MKLLNAFSILPLLLDRFGIGESKAALRRLLFLGSRFLDALPAPLLDCRDIFPFKNASDMVKWFDLINYKYWKTKDLI